MPFGTAHTYIAHVRENPRVSLLRFYSYNAEDVRGREGDVAAT